MSVEKLSGSKLIDVIMSGNQTHCLHVCFAPDYGTYMKLCNVPINLVLCILLCVKIIVQVCAFIGLLASTFVY